MGQIEFLRSHVINIRVKDTCSQNPLLSKKQDAKKDAKKMKLK